MRYSVVDAVKRVSRFARGNAASLTPVAYVGGWLGHANLGDEALLAAAGQLFPECRFWHFDGSRTMASLTRTFPRTTHGIYAGGTLINRSPEYLRLANQFLDLDKHLHFFGTGVADPAFWTSRDDFVDRRKEWKTTFDRCGYIGVRGPRSAELLADAGVPDVTVVGDPVISFSDELFNGAYTPNSIGFNIGHNHGHQWGDEKELQRQMLKLVQLAKAAGWSVRWLVVFPADLPITRALAKESGSDDAIYCSYRHPEGFIRSVRGLSAFVGMKLHATMLALCASVPSLMLEYDPKCLDFMRSIGQQEALIRTDQFEASRAWDLVRDWNSNRTRVAVAIYDQVSALRTSQREHARRLSNLIHCSS
jgi:hypothetical protein